MGEVGLLVVVGEEALMRGSHRCPGRRASEIVVQHAAHNDQWQLSERKRTLRIYCLVAG
jgi:hypothetical protein